MRLSYRPFRWLAVLAASLLLLTACGEKTEQQQLDALRSGFIYKRYSQASRQGVPVAYEAWRLGARLAESEPPPALTPEDECMIHGLLGYSALIGSKTTMAIAEADIVDDSPACQNYNQITAALRAVAFKRNQWPYLAHEQSELAASGGKVLNEQKTIEARRRMLVIHVLLGYLAISDGDWERSQVHSDAIAIALEQPWIRDFCRAANAIASGDVRQGLVTFKKLARNPQVPLTIRTELQQAIAEVEAETGPVDSRLWTARLFAMVVWQEIKEHEANGLGGMMAFVDQHAAGFGQALQEGKGMLGRWGDSAKGIWKASPAQDK